MLISSLIGADNTFDELNNESSFNKSFKGMTIVPETFRPSAAVIANVDKVWSNKINYAG